jgi:hypothetical protein
MTPKEYGLDKVSYTVTETARALGIGRQRALCRDQGRESASTKTWEARQYHPRGRDRGIAKQMAGGTDQRIPRRASDPLHRAN